ncbi:methyltransferase domain-containing protein [candidate division KSB1 bacterium]|nr:methyltransferase domain-containing protein [candidate division KSB1 bacterium]
MKKNLLNYLCCPVCKSDLLLSAEQTHLDHILNGEIVCRTNSAHHFRILNGVPRFAPLDQEADKKSRTADNFGYSWNVFNTRWDNDDIAFLDFIHPVEKAAFKNKIVLDAGCGMGRFAMLAREYGAKEVLAIDLSHSVDVAFSETKEFDNIHILQGDIYNLPIKQDLIELAYSVGVLHHLPSPKHACYSILNLLKTSGTFVMWVYGREGNEWIVRFINPIRNNITSKLPMPVLLSFSKFVGFFLWSILRLVYRPVNRCAPSISKYLPYNHYFKFTMTETLTQNIHTVFDHLLAPIAYYLSRDEIRSWLENANLKNIALHHLRSYSWTATGIKQ